MKSIFKKHGAQIVSVIATALLAAIWWVNGAEREDAWLYIAAILIVLSGIWATSSKKNKGNDQ